MSNESNLSQKPTAEEIRSSSFLRGAAGIAGAKLGGLLGGGLLGGGMRAGNGGNTSSNYFS
jgi:hypothetical protein